MNSKQLEQKLSHKIREMEFKDRVLINKEIVRFIFCQ